MKYPELARDFFFQVEEVVYRLRLDQRRSDNLLYSKLDIKDAATKAWIHSLRSRNALPASISDWQTLIWKECSIPALEKRYAVKLADFKQSNNMSYETFYLEYNLLMRRADVPDSATQAHLFTKALNKTDHFLLTTNARFQMEEENGTATIDFIHQLMLKLLVVRESNADVFKNITTTPKPSGLKLSA